MELEYENHKCNHEAIVAKFKNGPLLDSSSLKDIKYYTCENKFGFAGKKRKVLVTETERLQYAGANFGPASSSLDEHSRYYIGIANKKTKKVKVMNCSFFDLRPTIMGSFFEGASTSEPQEKDTRSRAEQNTDLILTFGSLKSKRKTESRLKHTVALPELNDVVVRSLEGMDFSHDETDTNSVNIFPPVNRSAARVGDLYQIRDLISAEEDEELTLQAKSFTETSDSELAEFIKEQNYDDFVMEWYSALDKSSKLEKTKWILYIQYLLKLTRADRTQFPPQLRCTMRKRFFDAGNEPEAFCNSNPKYIFRIKAYILAIVLIIKDYHIEDVIPIANLTSLSLTQLQSLANGVGASWIKKGKSNLCASIKVTFPIPPLRVTRTRNSQKGKRK